MNVIVAQSGGPTSVINASLAGVIDGAISNKYDNIYLSIHGIEGIINGEILKVDKKKYKKEKIGEKLKARPSSILGSCRFKLPSSFEDEVFDRIFQRLIDYEITTFIYIGGNDSMDTVMKLNQYMEEKSIEGINIIGCPKTIDNDLMEMDHSPGFGSAAKYIAKTMRSLRNDVDIYNLKSVTFVEIMGRNAGWLAASSLIANYKRQKDVVNLVYLPEEEKSIDQILEEIEKALERENNLIVAVAEGFRDKDAILEEDKFENKSDCFGHKIVAGVANRLADLVRERLEIKSRHIELSIVQRTALEISKTDADEAYTLGYKALEIGINKTNLIPIIKRSNNPEYCPSYQEVSPEKIANEEKKIPQEWLKDKASLNKKMISYTLPLIQGEVKQVYKDGMPVFVNLTDFAN